MNSAAERGNQGCSKVIKASCKRFIFKGLQLSWQSICFASRGSGVRIPVAPQKNGYYIDFIAFFIYNKHLTGVIAQRQSKWLLTTGSVVRSHLTPQIWHIDNTSFDLSNMFCRFFINWPCIWRKSHWRKSNFSRYRRTNWTQFVKER